MLVNAFVEREQGPVSTISIARLVQRSLSIIILVLFKLNSIVGCILLLVMVGIGALAVISRFVLHASISWSEEANTYLFVWLTSLGAAVALHLGIHPGIDGLVRRFPGWLQGIAFILGKIVTIAFGTVLLFYGTNLIMLMGDETGAAIDLPMSYAYAAVPYAGFCFIVISLASLVAPEAVPKSKADETALP
jgi:TRAP-type C4-dicarboxylate transport system permease small subunit